MPTTSTERMREKRARDKLTDEERDARLLAYRINLDIYNGTAVHFDRIRKLTGLDEPQDAAEYAGLLKKVGDCRDLRIKANAPVTLPNGNEMRSPKTGKVKMAWQDWDAKNDRIQIGA